MRHSRTLSLAGAVALAATLAACANTDPYGPNNYPVSDINPNPGGVALAPGNPATGGYYTQGPTTTYVTPGSTTTYVVPAGSTVVSRGNTYVAPGTAYAAPNTTVAAPSVEFGRVTNVALVSSGNGTSNANTGVSTLVGAGIGGLIGNTVGGGAGRIAATILGAFAGGAAGHALATRDHPNNYAGPVYRVWVATDTGAMRTYDVTATNLRPGDRVRIDNGVIYMG